MYKVSLLVLISMFAALAFGPVMAEPNTAPSGITVVGSAQTAGQPDTAYVVLGVASENASAAAAAQANAHAAGAVIDSAVGSGISRKDIQTTDYSVSPIIDYKKDPAVTVGYRVSNLVRIRVRDLSTIGGLIDAAIHAGANDVQGVTFTIQDDTPLRAQALAQATSSAAKKAQAIADALGVKLGPVVSVTESSGYSPRPMALTAARAGAAPASTPIAPGELEVTAEVTAVYSIIRS